MRYNNILPKYKQLLYERYFMSVTIDQLEAEWKKDSRIDITHMDDMASGVPSLHSKYISIISHCKRDILKVEKEYLQMRRIRTSYYNGTMTKEQLNTFGWDQYQEKRPLKTVLDELLQSDEYLMEVKMKIEELTICKEFLESVMKSIHSRTFDIKNAVEWYKYSNGMV
jgi:hypothetical protein